MSNARPASTAPGGCATAGARPGTDRPNGLGMRVAKVESAIEHIRTDVAEVRRDLREIKRDARLDFRLLFGALIVTALGLAGIVARGFGWL